MACFAARRRGREVRRVDGNPHYRPYRPIGSGRCAPGFWEHLVKPIDIERLLAMLLHATEARCSTLNSLHVREASAPPSTDKRPPPEIRSPHEIFRARQNAGGSDGNYDGDAFERARRGAAHGGPRAPRRVHRQVERGGRHDAERAESGRPLRPARRSLVCCRRALLDVKRDKREEGQATEPRLSVLSTRG